MTLPEGGAVASRLEQEALARWHRGGAAGPEPAIRIETRGRGYEVTASSPDQSATLWLSARFVNDLVSGTGSACARCADRFFAKLFQRLDPTRPL